jgi:hypothetical protein
MRRWCQKLADDLGVPACEQMETNRELVFEALRLELVAHHFMDDASRPPTRKLSETAK